MGNWNSTPAVIERPNGLTKLNDSVWELYRPEGVPQVEVIFFHGLQLSDYREAFWKTWLSRDDSVVWPKQWLGPALRNARISSVSYDSSARRTECAGSVDMYQIIENLFQDVVVSSRFYIEPGSEVILVGHSMGGLIIKQLLLKCLNQIGQLTPDNPQKERIETFLNNCRGIFYYSTPHQGSELAAYADRASRIPGAKINMPIINFLKVLSKETARINNEFSGVRKGRLNIKTRAIGEVRNTTFAGLSRMVVPEASSRYDVDVYTSDPEANHFDVCKAKSDTSSGTFAYLLAFCGSCAPEVAQGLPNLPDAPTHPVRPLPTAGSSSS